MDDLISRQAMLDMANGWTYNFSDPEDEWAAMKEIRELPSAQAMVCGYPVEHLILIATVLRKENLPPERVAELLMDIGRIVAMVRDEFEYMLRKAVDK